MGPKKKKKSEVNGKSSSAPHAKTCILFQPGLRIMEAFGHGNAQEVTIFNDSSNENKILTI